MIQNLDDLVTVLKDNPKVVGIARYGGRLLADLSEGGDFDLFVFLKKRPADLESFHFYVGPVPVDLNLRTLSDLEADLPLTMIDQALPDAEILYDETGDLSRGLATLGDRWSRSAQGLKDHDLNWVRFSHRHVLDKVKGRIGQDPVYCDFLLGANIFWLVQAYFRARSMDFPGEKPALKLLEKDEPDLYGHIKRFYGSGDLREKFAISELLTEVILAPIGGPWQQGELIALGTHEDARNLESTGERMFSELLGAVMQELPVDLDDQQA